MSTSIAGPPSTCCITGVRHEGQPKGEMKKIGEVETYYTYPENKSTDKAILFLTDAFGHSFQNNKLVADDFAANGYFVAMPDLFNGDPVPESVLTDGFKDFDLMAWVGKHGPDVTDPIVDSVLQEMRGPLGCKTIAGTGYCFGGKYVVRHLRTNDSSKLDVGFVAHPSFVMEDEVKEMQGPLAIAAAETDSIFPADKRHLMEEMLKELGHPYQINLYSGVAHGFAIKGDMSDKQARWAKEEAFMQAVRWFQNFA